MNHFITKAILLILIVTIFNSSCSKKSVKEIPVKAKKPVQEEIMSTLDGMFTAYEKRDIEAIMSFYSKDADMVVIGIGSDKKRIGPEELRAGFKQDFAKANTGVEICLPWTLISISESGSTAWVAVDAVYSLKTKGKINDIPFRMTSVLEKFDGKWLIVQSHSSVPINSLDENQ